MDVKNWTAVLIGLLVGVLVLACFIPSITAYTDETKTIKNTGSYFTTPDDGEHTIIIEDGVITFDDNECVWPNFSYFGSVTLMAGEDWCLRADSYNSTTQVCRITIAGPPHTFDVLGVYGPNTDTSIVITINGDDVSIIPYTGDVAGTERTPEGLLYTIADKGDYVMSYKPYLLEDTVIFGSIRNNNNSANADIFENVTGTIGDYENMTVSPLRLYKSTADPSTGDFTSNVFTVDTENVTSNLYKLDKINQTFTLWDDSSATIYLSYLIVPETITYDNPAYVGNVLSIIMQMLPLIIGVGMLMVGVAYFVTRY